MDANCKLAGGMASVEKSYLRKVLVEPKKSNMKNKFSLLFPLMFLLMSCRENSKEFNFGLVDIVEVEIINKSFRKENYLEKRIITDSKTIYQLIALITDSEITEEDLNKSGGTQGFIEIKFINHEGKKEVFNNLYTVYKGAFLIHYEKWDTETYMNLRFIDEIESLLYVGESVDEISKKVISR